LSFVARYPNSSRVSRWASMSWAALLLAEHLAPASGLAGAEELGLAVGSRLDESTLVLLGFIPRSA